MDNLESCVDQLSLVDCAEDLKDFTDLNSMESADESMKLVDDELSCGDSNQDCDEAANLATMQLVRVNLKHGDDQLNREVGEKGNEERSVDQHSYGDCGQRCSESDIAALELLEAELIRVLSHAKQLRTTAPNYDTYYKELEEMIRDSLVLFNAHRDLTLGAHKVWYWKTRGTILLETLAFRSGAIEAFTKVVKLDPGAVDCWNKLGELYCEYSNYDLCRQCFLCGLEQKENVVSLQNLSMLSRLKKETTQKDLVEGIKYAKQALALDFSNGKSWTVLGNAYMGAFFGSDQDERFMNQALNAYNQAELRCPELIDSCNNKFIALKFVERYEEAIKTILPCTKVPADLDWRKIKPSFISLMNYLREVQVLVDKKGKLRNKKRCEHLKQLNLSLSSSTILDTEMLGVVLWNANPDGSFPYTVGLMNAAEEIVVITIYNLARDFGFKVGDIVKVPMQTMARVDFEINGEAFNFVKIRIQWPGLLEYNGKPMLLRHIVPCTITSS